MDCFWGWDLIGVFCKGIFFIVVLIIEGVIVIVKFLGDWEFLGIIFWRVDFIILLFDIEIFDVVSCIFLEDVVVVVKVGDVLDELLDEIIIWVGFDRDGVDCFDIDFDDLIFCRLEVLFEVFVVFGFVNLLNSDIVEVVDDLVEINVDDVLGNMFLL